MSRYEQNLTPKGLKDCTYHVSVGYDRKNETFYLQANEPGEDTAVHLGKTRHEYTNLQIFVNAAELAGVTIGPVMRAQLISDQFGRASAARPEPGSEIEGWVVRWNEYPQLFKQSTDLEDHSTAPQDAPTYRQGGYPGGPVETAADAIDRKRREFISTVGSLPEPQQPAPTTGWSDNDIFEVNYSDNIQVQIDRSAAGEIEVRLWRIGEDNPFESVKAGLPIGLCKIDGCGDRVVAHDDGEGPFVGFCDSCQDLRMKHEIDFYE